MEMQFFPETNSYQELFWPPATSDQNSTIIINTRDTRRRLQDFGFGEEKKEVPNPDWPNCQDDDFGATVGSCPWRAFDRDCYPCLDHEWYPDVYSASEDQKYTDLGCQNADEMQTSPCDPFDPHCEDVPTRIEIATRPDMYFCYYEGSKRSLLEFFLQDDPCLQYLKSNDTKICTLCRYGAVRIFFTYNDDHYVWCGYIVGLASDGVNTLCSLASYYADQTEIYTENRYAHFQEDYLNNTNSESAGFCVRKTQIINDNCKLW